MERAAAVAAFGNISAVTPLTFSLASPGTNASLGFGKFISSYVPVVNGFASPGASFGRTPGRTVNDVDIGNVWLTPTGQIPTIGNDLASGYSTIAHEMNHVLGLAHTSDVALAPNENNRSYSLMSKFPTVNQSVFPSDLQLYDIASLQNLYGRNDFYNVGDNTYLWSDFIRPNPNASLDAQAPSTLNRYWNIWDAGG